MIISNIIKNTFSLLIVMTLLSCVGKKQIINEAQQIETQPKLLFLNYKIDKIDDKKAISLINQITTDGKLKATITDKNHKNSGDLECIILDKDLNPIQTYSIKNPLKKVVEFINDSGEFEKKILDLDSVQFSLKLQLKSKSKYVVITEITANSIIKHITTKIE